MPYPGPINLSANSAGVSFGTSQSTVAACVMSLKFITKHKLSSSANGAPKRLSVPGPLQTDLRLWGGVLGGESKACPERSRRGSAFAQLRIAEWTLDSGL